MLYKVKIRWNKYKSKIEKRAYDGSHSACGSILGESWGKNHNIHRRYSRYLIKIQIS